MSSFILRLVDIIPLVEVALMRSGGLIDLDQLMDEPDEVKRVMQLANVLIKNAEHDPLIKQVLKQVLAAPNQTAMTVLKDEAIRRRNKQLQANKEPIVEDR